MDKDFARYELRLAVEEVGDDGKPTEKCYTHLHIQARLGVDKIEREDRVRLTLNNISDVEWISKDFPTILFTYSSMPKWIIGDMYIGCNGTRRN